MSQEEVKVKGLFGFEMEQRNVCVEDKTVRYKKSEENCLVLNVPKEKIVYEEEVRWEIRRFTRVYGPSLSPLLYSNS